MAINSNISLLDPGQIVKRVFEVADDSVRITFGDAAELMVDISAADGDSVTIYPRSVPNKASITNANTGVVVAAFACDGLKSFNLYTDTTSTIVGAQALTLEISPSDTDNVWISSGLSVTPSTTNGTVVMGTAIANVVARRARVSIAAAITSGTFDVYVVAAV